MCVFNYIMCNYIGHDNLKTKNYTRRTILKKVKS